MIFNEVEAEVAVEQDEWAKELQGSSHRFDETPNSDQAGSKLKEQ